MNDPDDMPDALLEHAKKAYPSALSIEKVALGAAGLDGYWISMSSGPPDRGLGVVSADGVTFFDRVTGMKQVLDTGRDPLVLARASMLLLQHGGNPLSGPEDVPAREQDLARQAGVAAPALSGDTLTYWSYYTKTQRPDLLRTTVDLATLDVKTSHPGDDADPVDKATGNLKSPNDVTRRMAVEALAKLCGSEPRAVAALIEVLGSHAKADTRMFAAENLGACPGKTTVAALTKALAGDSDVDVRASAAASLGTLADPAAKPALEKAAKGDAHDGVRRVAEAALKKIP